MNTAIPTFASRASLLPVELRQLPHLQRRIILCIACVGCALRLLFWFYTDRVWEDALITVLHSENFAGGLGLTHHHPGYAPLHGFTSPLSVLIPLAADIFHIGWGLPFQKLVSALISVPTVLLAGAIALNPAFRLNFWLVSIFCSYLAFEHHQILWGMAGMETQVAVFALMFAMYCALKGDAKMIGLSMAFLIYARPDFAIFAAVVALYIAMARREALYPSLGIALALYTPWIVFTLTYYGSPVPNTILAKSMGYSLWTRHTALLSEPFWANVWARVHDYIYLPLGPSFSGHGTGFLKFLDDGLVSRLCTVILLVGCAAMLRSFQKFYAIPLLACLAYSTYYVFFVPAIAGWYLVPFSAINCLLLVLGLGAVFEYLIVPARIPALSRLACILYVTPFLMVLPTTFAAERDIQRYIETPVRRALGTYLFEHKKPGDTVGCEPLGYIGYYSRMPVYDYPGLASPEVSAFMRKNPDKRTMDRMLEALQPSWIVLREHELRYMNTLQHMSFLQTGYTIEKTFRSDPVHTGEVFRAASNIDLTFVLLKKSRP